MFFALVCIVQLIWLLVAYSFIYLKKPVEPMSYFTAVLTATIWALPAAYKLSFGG